MKKTLLALLLVPIAGLAAMAVGLWYAGGIPLGEVEVDRSLLLVPGAPGPEPGPFEPFAFAAVSDLHFGKRQEAEAVALLAGIPGLEGAPFGEGRALLPPRFVVTCGDNVENGEGADAAAEYRRFKTAMDATGLPYYYANGNHDVYGAKDSIRGLKAEPFAGGRGYYRFAHGGVHFLVLDYYADDAGDTPPAELDDDQKAWFRAALLEIGPRQPIVLVFHPLPERWEWIRMPPWIAMSRSEATFLASSIREFNVLAILCGHYHVHHVETWQGLPVIDVGSWSSGFPIVVAGQAEDGRMTFVSFRDGDRGSGKVLVERPLEQGSR